MKKIFALSLAGFLLPAYCCAAPLTVASNGKSTFSIILPENAPPSVQQSAQELQKDIQLSTGATLPILSDSATANGPLISLGKTKQAQTAGISLNHVMSEGFRIVTKNGNIYILGPDTAKGALTAEGGTSNGTANGVYTFLEDYLNVRWLMPGRLGLDVPTKSTFTVNNINRTEAPFFINRREPYIQNKLPAVAQWENHQKLGYSFRINHSHNWTQTVTPDLFKDHPEWFAMIDGKRIPPSGRYKLETTNPGLVRFFAGKAVDSLQANPQMNTFSLSPSDSRGWSESPESKALYDPAPKGSTHPSVTPLILKFYRDVSDIVVRQYPRGKLAGYIYADYLYPPTKGGMTLPDNFYPVIAPSIDYGFTLYRPDIQHDFNDLMQEWSKVTPHLFYYDLPNTITPNSGIVTPPATEILNFIFPRLVQNNVKGVYIYGMAAWGQTALSNYILAKMMWNPHLDAAQIQHDWLIRAYGPAAGAAMETFYAKLDAHFRDYYRQHDSARYTITPAILKDLYAAHYPELEQLFLAAKSQQMTPVQQQRLALLEDNMIVLQWRLRTGKYLPAAYHSPLTRSDDEVMDILLQQNDDFDLFPGMIDNGPTVKPVSVKIGSAVGEAPSKITIGLRNKTQTLLYSATGGEVEITPFRASGGKPFINFTLKDNHNKIIKSGLVTRNKAIAFTTQAHVPYYLYINSGIYGFTVQGAAAAVQSNTDGGRLHLFGSPATLYAYVPSGVDNWDLTLSTAAPGETGKVTVTSPDGKIAAELVTVSQPAQSVSLKGQEGFWKIDITKAESGVLDDIFLHFDTSISPWLSLNPAQPLIVESK